MLLQHVEHFLGTLEAEVLAIKEDFINKMRFLAGGESIVESKRRLLWQETESKDPKSTV